VRENLLRLRAESGNFVIRDAGRRFGDRENGPTRLPQRIQLAGGGAARGDLLFERLRRVFKVAVQPDDPLTPFRGADGPVRGLCGLPVPGKPCRTIPSFGWFCFSVSGPMAQQSAFHDRRTQEAV
jgi:hypothetical protein